MILLASLADHGRLIVGFTGTRGEVEDGHYSGMNPRQQRSCELFAERFKIAELVHGGCVGSDEQMHRIVIGFCPDAQVAIRPGPDLGGEFVAQWCLSEGGTVVLPGKSHFARNRDIVDNVDVMIATPPTVTDPGRGGTWYTINYAKKVGKPLLIFFPDGSMWSSPPAPASG